MYNCHAMLNQDRYLKQMAAMFNATISTRESLFLRLKRDTSRDMLR